MNPDPKKLAQLFGSIGGKARAKKLSKESRQEIARMGAEATNAKRKALPQARPDQGQN
jgi:hypothetical protein